MRSEISQWFELLLFYLLITLETHGKKSVQLDRTSCRQTCLLYYTFKPMHVHWYTVSNSQIRPPARLVLRSFNKHSRSHNIHLYTEIYHTPSGLGCHCRYMGVCMRMHIRKHHARSGGFMSMSTNGEDFNTEVSWGSELGYQQKTSRTIIEIDSIYLPTT